MSLLLEFRFSKQAIITAYLNEVFLLQQNRVAIHGFERASRMMFRRSLEHLEAQHLALLVGMVKGPSRYNPFSHPEAAHSPLNSSSTTPVGPLLCLPIMISAVFSNS